MRERRKPEPKYRRSPALVTYWSIDGFTYFDCASGTRQTIPASVVPLLDALAQWQTIAAFRKRHPELGTRAEVSDLFRRLQRMRLIERDDRALADWSWKDWMPDAAFFHFGTRDAKYPTDLLEHELPLVEKAKTIPQPAPTKRSAGSRLQLPAASDMGELERTLKARRTWRQFSDEPISLTALSTMLSLTFGVQKRGRVKGQGGVVFKTSPSGGARHPIEAYVMAQSVSSLPPAVYHYDCATHELVEVGRRVSPAAIEKVLGNQYYFRNSAVVVVMTACFERTMWRYPFSRAYRSVLIEAGHLGQTLVLLATAMGLAPYQTIAFHDTQLESMLGLNEANEGAMYVVGVGGRSTDVIDHPGRILPKEP